MEAKEILIPTMVLIGWTLCVLLLMPYQRFKAGFAGQVTAADFKYGESSRVPPHVCIPNRNFMNLLEVPTLFYVISLLLFITKFYSAVDLILAWIFVLMRVVHSLIHLSYNNVMHRLVAYAFANGVLVLMWMRLFFEIVTN